MTCWKSARMDLRSQLIILSLGLQPDHYTAHWASTTTEASWIRLFGQKNFCPSASTAYSANIYPQIFLKNLHDINLVIDDAQVQEPQELNYSPQWGILELWNATLKTGYLTQLWLLLHASCALIKERKYSSYHVYWYKPDFFNTHGLGNHFSWK